MNLSERQKEYESISDYSLVKRVPIIIRCDGRNFARVTRKAQKPYDPIVHSCMAQAMLLAVADMQGAVFAYTQSDEITFVIRSDQSLEAEPWFQNRIQKIVSVSSSLVTYGFNKALSEQQIKPELIGPTLFDARVFMVPSLIEAANNLIYRQKDCLKNAIAGAAQANLAAKVGKKTALNSLHGKKSAEKKKMMLDVCQVDFEEYYPASFRHGVAAYKIPTIIDKEKNTLRNKWYLNWDLPFFVDEKDFLMNIILNGHDILRPVEVIKAAI